MIKKLGVVLAVVAITVAVSSRFAVRVLGASSEHVLITENIDENRLVTLVGNTRPEARAANDRGREPDSFPVNHMLLQLKRDPQVEREFEQFIESLTDKSSPNFRHWISAEEQGARYGVAQADIDAITGWLASHGFIVGHVYPNRMVIDFSGNAGQIREAFHTEIHELELKDKQHFANMSDAKIPAALAPAIEGVVSMHNFKPHPMNQLRTTFTFAGCGGDCFALVPADLQKIYNVSPLLKAGITGKGQTVVAVGDSNVFGSDLSTFRTKFGLTTFGGTFTAIHPNSAGNCTNPGTNGDDIESNLDVQMITAMAPGAHVEMASCADGSSFATFGGLIAIQNLISVGSPPPIISMSYGVCEVLSGAAANAAFNKAFQTAAAAGVSVFVSSGDNAASACARDFTGGDSIALPGIGVTGWGETPYNVSVGGTDFEDLYNAVKGGPPQSTYWNASNSSTFGSAKSYIPEIPWNNSCAGFLLYDAEGFSTAFGANGFCNSSTGANFLGTVGGSGGPSNCAKGAGKPSFLFTENTTCAGYAKPSWQSGIFGNPADSVRDVPDVSLFAANGLWGHFIIICYSDASFGGVPCTGSPSGWVGVGGTSASSPEMAGIQALVNQKWNIRAGNPNPTYYKIAKAEYGTTGNSSCFSINQTQTVSNCVFYDITQGDIDINCQHNGSVFSADCYLPSGSNGVLSTQKISSLSVRTAGSGYATAPTCKIAAPANKSKYLSPTSAVLYAGGVTATCTATINTTTHVVSGLTLTNAGKGYTGVPVCTLSGGGGTGASCKAVINPTVSANSNQPAFGATPGWDMATGIGSVNANNLVQNTAW
jgi:subtilase family serine protease